MKNILLTMSFRCKFSIKQLSTLVNCIREYTLYIKAEAWWRCEWFFSNLDSTEWLSFEKKTSKTDYSKI